MNLQQIFLALYLTVSSVFATDLPRCIDLQDNTEPFFVKYLNGTRTCTWAGRQNTDNRCFNFDEVTANCPKTCTKDCLSEPPSEAPSVSLSPTVSPTAHPTRLPSSSPSDFVMCDERVDNQERFYIEGTLGMRLCDWVSRNNTETRCQMEDVRRNCQLTCNIPCNERPEPANFAQSNEGPPSPKEKFPYDIVFITIGSVALVVVVSLVIYKRKEWFASKFDQNDRGTQVFEDDKNNAPLEFDETDDAVDADWCGWGAAPNRTNLQQPEKEMKSKVGAQSV